MLPSRKPLIRRDIGHIFFIRYFFLRFFGRPPPPFPIPVPVSFFPNLGRDSFHAIYARSRIVTYGCDGWLVVELNNSLACSTWGRSTGSVLLNPLSPITSAAPHSRIILPRKRALWLCTSTTPYLLRSHRVRKNSALCKMKENHRLYMLSPSPPPDAVGGRYVGLLSLRCIPFIRWLAPWWQLARKSEPCLGVRFWIHFKAKHVDARSARVQMYSHNQSKPPPPKHNRRIIKAFTPFVVVFPAPIFGFYNGRL